MDLSVIYNTNYRPVAWGDTLEGQAFGQLVPTKCGVNIEK